MPVSQVLLKVSPVNDLAQAAVTVDVTADILAVGKTAYNIGSASTTRWFWAVITDSAGNSNTFPLGSYTTAAAASTSVTIEASRVLDAADPVYVSGSVGSVVNTTDLFLSKGQYSTLKLSNDATAGFTVGVRLKFDNTTQLNNTNDNMRHHAFISFMGSTSGAFPVYFNLFYCTQTGVNIRPGVRWWSTNTNTGVLIGNTTTVMKLSYFWIFFTGTAGGTISCRAFDTDNATLTAESTYTSNMPALAGNLWLRVFNEFNNGATNNVTVDKFWYKPGVDTAVTPASTV